MSKEMSIVNRKFQPATSIFHKLPIKLGKRQPLLIFIPGNPGLINYYNIYLNLLQKKYPAFEILNISHAGFGHQTQQDQEFRFYNLDYQINHKIEIIKEYLTDASKIEGEKRDIFIMGHSVGSYILQRVVLNLIKDPDFSSANQFKFIGMICPTIIDISKSTSGIKFSFLFRWFPVIRLALLLSWVVSKLPDQFVVFLLNIIMNNPTRDSIDATKQLVKTPRIVEQALTLANEEMKVINRDVSLNDEFYNLSDGGTKIWNFFSITDHWVHDESRDFLLQRYGNKELSNKNLYFTVGELDTNISHSFCVNQNEEFAEISIALLDELFPDLKEV